MKRLFAFICFIIFPSIVLGIGLGDWSCQTPHQNQIDNFQTSYTLKLINGKEIKYLKEWAFEKDYIITKSEENNSVSFLIIDEKNFTIERYKEILEWKNSLQNKNIDISKLVWLSNCFCYNIENFYTIYFILGMSILLYFFRIYKLIIKAK